MILISNPIKIPHLNIFKQVDIDHSGTLDFEEFSNLTGTIKHQRNPVQDLRLCWNVFGTKI